MSHEKEFRATYDRQDESPVNPEPSRIAAEVFKDAAASMAHMRCALDALAFVATSEADRALKLFGQHEEAADVAEEGIEEIDPAPEVLDRIAADAVKAGVSKGEMDAWLERTRARGGFILTSEEAAHGALDIGLQMHSEFARGYHELLAMADHRGMVNINEARSFGPIKLKAGVYRVSNYGVERVGEPDVAKQFIPKPLPLTGTPRAERDIIAALKSRLSNTEIVLDETNDSTVRLSLIFDIRAFERVIERLTS